VGLLQAWAFTNTELHRLEIKAAVDNIASQQVALKSGATREAILKQRLLLHGYRHDAVLFSIIRPAKS
jgi:RimJ/RimL family protein N-acetyltransferase